MYQNMIPLGSLLSLSAYTPYSRRFAIHTNINLTIIIENIHICNIKSLLKNNKSTYNSCGTFLTLTFATKPGSCWYCHYTITGWNKTIIWTDHINEPSLQSFTVHLKLGISSKIDNSELISLHDILPLNSHLES